MTTPLDCTLRTFTIRQEHMETINQIIYGIPVYSNNEERKIEIFTNEPQGE